MFTAILVNRYATQWLINMKSIFYVKKSLNCTLLTMKNPIIPWRLAYIRP